MSNYTPSDMVATNTLKMKIKEPVRKQKAEARMNSTILRKFEMTIQVQDTRDRLFWRLKVDQITRSILSAELTSLRLAIPSLS